MDIQKNKLEKSDLTILFHVDGKVYAPIMNKEDLIGIKLMAVSATEELVEVVQPNIKIKRKGVSKL